MNFIPSKVDHENNMTSGHISRKPVICVQGDMDLSSDSISDEEFEAIESLLSLPHQGLEEKKNKENHSHQLQKKSMIINSIFNTKLLHQNDRSSNQKSSINTSRMNSNTPLRNQCGYKEPIQSKISYQTIQSEKISQESCGNYSGNNCSSVTFLSPRNRNGNSGKNLSAKSTERSMMFLAEQEQTKANNQEKIFKQHKDEKPLKRYDSNSQKEFFLRLNNDAKLIQESKMKKAEDNLRKEMEQCTFTPQLFKKEDKIDCYSNFQCDFDQGYSQIQSPGSRSLQQFLADQAKFQKKQSQKINRIKFEMEQNSREQSTYQPKINSKSEAILKEKEKLSTNNNQKQSAYERLYQATSKIKEGPENSFQPSINEKSKVLLRNGTVCQNLYQDALRRQEKSISNLNSKMAVIEYKTNGVSGKTELMVATKFVNEFEKVCDEMMVDQAVQQINYIQMAEILNKLNFTKDGQFQVNMQERKLVADMWKYLRGENAGFVTKCNLCQMLLFVLGIFGFQLKTREQMEYENDRADKVQEIIEEEELSQDDQNSYETNECTRYLGMHQKNQNQSDVNSNQKPKKLLKGKFDKGGNFYANLNEAKGLQREFDVLYRNRLSGQKMKVVIQPNKENDIKMNSSQQSSNLVNSSKMAQKQREKILQEAASLMDEKSISIPNCNGKLSHVDLLTIQKQVQLKKREIQYEHKENEIKQSCSFQPQILSPSSEKETFLGGMKKSIQLFDLAQRNEQRKKQERHKLDLQIEKSFNECTFQPNISASVRSKSIINFQKNLDGNSAQLSECPSKRSSTPIRTVLKEKTDKMRNKNSGTFNIHNQTDFFQNNQLPNHGYEISQTLPPQLLNCSPEKEAPYLYIDVTLPGNIIERISVCKGDTPTSLSKSFRVKHNMSDDMAQKLKQFIEYQMSIPSS